MIIHVFLKEKDTKIVKIGSVSVEIGDLEDFLRDRILNSVLKAGFWEYDQDMTPQ